MAKKKLKLEDVLVPKEEIPYEVPENWCWSNINSISERFTDGDWILSSNFDDNGKVRVLQLADIGIGRFVDKSNRFINESTFNELKCTEIYTGDILISRMAEPIGRSMIVPKLNQKLVTAVDVSILTPNEKIVKRDYLNYLFNSNYFRESCEKLARGTTRLRITRKNLGLIPIPIPPLAEQERIVNRIESLFDKVDKAAGLVDEARDGFEKRRAAILEGAFSGELTKKWRDENGVSDASKELEDIKKNNNRKYQKLENEYLEREIPENWCWTNLGELIELLSDYHSNGSYKILKEKVELLDEPDYAMMIRTTNFEKNNFEDLMKYITKDAYEFMEKSKLFGGEILINKIGNAGSAYYMPHFNRPASLAMNLFMLRLVSDVDSKYIYYHLNTIYSTGDIKQFVRGITTKTIDKKSINSLKIALPPLDEQREIVGIVDSLLGDESNIEYICNMEESINNIKKSILAKAFRGELGSNNLNEGSSLELLNRIVE